MRLSLPDGVRQDLEERAERGYPEEICGILVGRLGESVQVLEAHPCANVDFERSSDRYRLDPREQLAVERSARLRGLDVVGYYHSHPDHPALPSATDLAHSWEGVAYAIVSVRRGRAADLRVWVRGLGEAAFSEVDLEGEARKGAGARR